MTKVLFVPFSDPSIPQAGSQLEWKRRTLWDNSARNDLIAEIARGLSRKPRKTLRKWGVNWKDVNLPGIAKVTILVETPEHARRLSELLPLWEVQEVIPFDYELHEVEADPSGDPPPGHIATLVFAARFGIRSKIVVRATGRTGTLCEEWFRDGRGLGIPLIVDFRDHSNQRAGNDSDFRRHEYHEQNFRELRPTKTA